MMSVLKMLSYSSKLHLLLINKPHHVELSPMVKAVLYKTKTTLAEAFEKGFNVTKPELKVFICFLKTGLVNKIYKIGFETLLVRGCDCWLY